MESRARVRDIKKKFENLNNHETTAEEEKGKTSVLSSNGESNGHRIIKRTPAFRNAKLIFPTRNTKVTDVKPTRSSDPSDTLKKKVLASPLPPGPAPIKPPRTFAHQFNGKTVIKSCLSDETQREHNIQSLKRSKTEPHIMLKKIESALLVNQPTVRTSPISEYLPKVPAPLPRLYPPPENIYDKPFLRNRTETVPNCFRLFKPSCIKTEPIYTEPYVPNSPKYGVQQRNILNSNHHPTQTLHYMSTPIMIDHQGNDLPQNTPYQEAFEKIRMKINDNYNRNRSGSESDNDSAKEVKQQVVTERKIYAQRVSSVRMTNVSSQAKSTKLIDTLLLVGIDNEESNGYTAYIKAKYPKNGDVPENFARLIFPDVENWPQAISNLDNLPKSTHHNNYTIVITAADGSRSYAYCQRLQPEGSPVCLPLAYVILTKRNMNTLYYKILKLLETKHGLPKAEYIQFVNALVDAKYFKSLSTVKIGSTSLAKKSDLREESSDISKLLQIVTVPVFLKLFSSLLLERKIILVSSYISVLSDCLEGLLKSLYPFEWQHTVISLLPVSMSELLEAPTPYIAGVLRGKNSQPVFKDIDDAIAFDIDSGKIVKKVGDENSIIPDRLLKALKDSLYLVPVHSTDVAPSEAIMRLFVELIGHYSNHLTTTDLEKNRTFHKETFIKAPNSRGVRLFLEWFTETALFHSFIQDKIERNNDFSLFEKRCADFIQEAVIKGNTKRGFRTLKDWATSSSS